MDVNDLEFITTKSHRGFSDKDIGLTLSKTDVLCITVRNNSEQKIAKIHNRTARYVLIAFKDGRLYFKGTDSKDGFVFAKNANSKNKYIRVNTKYMTDDFKEWVLDNEGQFDLRYDTEANLYYVSNELQFMGKGGK